MRWGYMRPPGWMRLRAVLTEPTWPKAWGKLPSTRAAPGPYCSDSSPTLLRRSSRRWRSLWASACLPRRVRLSAGQNAHSRNVPSLGPEAVNAGDGGVAVEQPAPR